MFAVQLLILALYLVSWYKMFEKMGRQGWEGLIPIYNMVILLEVIKKPWWWVLLMLFIPIVNIVFMIGFVAAIIIYFVYPDNKPLFFCVGFGAMLLKITEFFLRFMF